MKLIKADATRPASVGDVMDFMILNGADLWSIRLGPVADKGRRYLVGVSATDPGIEFMVTFEPKGA